MGVVDAAWRCVSEMDAGTSSLCDGSISDTRSDAAPSVAAPSGLVGGRPGRRMLSQREVIQVEEPVFPLLLYPDPGEP